VVIQFLAATASGRDTSATGSSDQVADVEKESASSGADR